MYWHVQNFNNEHDARAFMLQTSQQLQAAQSHYPVDMVKQETGYVVRVGPFATQQHIDDVKSKLPNLALHHL
ncbi:SPOR domain-containing protein [Alysiella filiformis DSM 16848]|nr:SPOR domain-containing protein [Alysiella filiformis]UBQ57333.1 SPOR domain-containing protein [Alysiella filiformis DSM 16848]